MAHTIKYNPEEQIIEIIAQGTVNLDEFNEIVSQGIQLAKEKECFHILGDYRNVTVVSLSTLEIYDLPKMLSGISASTGIDASRFRRAIVVAPKDAADAEFAETVAVNRGQNAKIFQDIDEAKKWLSEK
jgi:hypothetical protein